MPIDKNHLDALARRYVATMTSIRGRRVHRLLTRGFARFDTCSARSRKTAPRHCSRWPTTAAPRSSAATAAARPWRPWRSSRGRGSTARGVTTAYDLVRDSLPISGRSVWHPGFVRPAGALTITGTGLSSAEIEHIAGVLRRVAQQKASQAASREMTDG